MTNPSDSKLNSKSESKKTSTKKYLLIGGVFVFCVLLLKRDAH